MALKDIQVLILGPVNCYFMWHRDFTDVIEEFEKEKLSWITHEALNIITSVLIRGRPGEI